MPLTFTISHQLFRNAIRPSCRRKFTNAALAKAQELLSESRNVLEADQEVKSHLRKLFRNMAQPVAVVTSFMPAASGLQTPQSPFHGATLSSFTSIAMDPSPLVAFALRVPSRMATTLNTLPSAHSVHMVVNLLATNQADAAVAFSRPDLHPKPFDTCGTAFELSEEGLPVLHDVVGAISCQLVGRGISLHDTNALAAGKLLCERKVAIGLNEGEVASELFIARVVRVESLGDERTLPLVYHRRAYTTC